MTTYTDSARNRVIVSSTPATYEDKPIVIARLADNPATGYIALAGDFGNDSCPDSPAVLTWFGPGERYPNADSAIKTIGS